VPFTRNVFDANPEIDMEVLAMVTSYTRRVTSSLDKLGDGVLFAAGVTFGHPEEEAETIRKKSNYLEKLAKGDLDLKKT
jgi:cytochrome b pre-mRNA-processing protein 3